MILGPCNNTAQWTSAASQHLKLHYQVSQDSKHLGMQTNVLYVNAVSLCAVQAVYQQLFLLPCHTPTPTSTAITSEHHKREHQGGAQQCPCTAAYFFSTMPRATCRPAWCRVFTCTTHPRYGTWPHKLCRSSRSRCGIYWTTNTQVYAV